jgi:hypothetical protein
MRRNRRGLLWIAVIGVIPFLAAGPDESLWQRRERIENMSAEEISELVRKKKRFESLSPEQQRRLRQLHHQISRDPRAEQLRQTLVHYHEWLKTLTPAQQAGLQGLPPVQRIARIKELREERHFRILSDTKLSPDDAQQVIFWAGRYVMRHQDLILSWMPLEFQRRVHETDDPQQRRRMVFVALARRGPDQKLPLPEPNEIKMLMNRLSPGARELFTNEPQMTHKIMRWLDELSTTRRMPPVKDEELRRFFSEVLSDEERQRLDLLPGTEKKFELTRMYYRHMRKSLPLKNRFPPRGDGPRPRPPGDGPRFDGPTGPRRPGNDT